MGAAAPPGAPGGNGVRRGGGLPGGDPTWRPAPEGDDQRPIGADHPLRRKHDDCCYNEGSV